MVRDVFSGSDEMGLNLPTTRFDCEIDDGLAHIIFRDADRGNPIDGVFCHEISMAMAELSEREDVRAVLISARGKMFSVGGDLGALGSQGSALPATVKVWTAGLHSAIVRMVRMRAPVVVAVQGNVAGGSVSLMARVQRPIPELISPAEPTRLLARRAGSPAIRKARIHRGSAASQKSAARPYLRVSLSASRTRSCSEHLAR